MLYFGRANKRHIYATPEADIHCDCIIKWNASKRCRPESLIWAFAKTSWCQIYYRINFAHLMQEFLCHIFWFLSYSSFIVGPQLCMCVQLLCPCPPPQPKGRGTLFFGADPVGVGVTLSCLHDISWTGCQILTKFIWIEHRDMVKSWLGFEILLVCRISWTDWQILTRCSCI